MKLRMRFRCTLFTATAMPVALFGRFRGLASRCQGQAGCTSRLLNAGDNRPVSLRLLVAHGAVNAGKMRFGATRRCRAVWETGLEGARAIGLESAAGQIRPAWRDPEDVPAGRVTLRFLTQPPRQRGGEEAFLFFQKPGRARKRFHQAKRWPDHEDG